MDVCGQHHAPASVPRGKSPRNALRRILDQPQNLYARRARFGALVGNGIKVLYLSSHSVVTVPTELWRHIQVCWFQFWAMSVHTKTRQPTEVQIELILSDSEVQNRSGTCVIDDTAVTVLTACWLDSGFAEGQAVLDPTEEPVQWYWLYFPRRPRKLERDVDNSSLFGAERSEYFEALSPPPHVCSHVGRMHVHSSARLICTKAVRNMRSDVTDLT